MRIHEEKRSLSPQIFLEKGGGYTFVIIVRYSIIGYEKKKKDDDDEESIIEY